MPNLQEAQLYHRDHQRTMLKGLMKEGCRIIGTCVSQSVTNVVWPASSKLSTFALKLNIVHII